MEQYDLALDKVYGDILYSLENYKAKRIFIRLVGSKISKYRGKKPEIDEDLESKTLSIKQTEEGLSILIDGSEVFMFEQEERLDSPGEYWGKNFSVGYERDPDEKTGVIPRLPTGINPDDPNLPPVNTSSFRCTNKDYLLEIFFEGKIPLKFHSWFEKPHWKYWCVDTETIDKK